MVIKGTKKQKRTSIYIGAGIVAVICLSMAMLTGTRTVSSCRADIDGDGLEDTMQITGRGIGRFGDNLVIRTQNGEQIYDFSDWRPWKVQTADVDGDGDIEVSVGVFKTTRFDPEYKKRPFLYNWDQDGISPKWLGSRLSREFEDYIFADVDGDGSDDILSVELLPDGGKVINAYRWKGFGFIGLGESRAFDDIGLIEAGSAGSRINAKVKLSGKWQWVTLVYQNEQLILED